MGKAVRFSIMALMLAGLTLGQGQCPIQWPKPPFDTAGAYSGTWQGTAGPEAQAVPACPLSVSLTQDLTLPYPQDHGVKGTVTVEYSCLDLPDWLAEIPPSEVQVGGILGDDGKLVLASGGCTTALCLVLVMDGHGADTDDDGHMDTYTGSWSFTILLAGVQPFGSTGTFTLTAPEVTSAAQP